MKSEKNILIAFILNLFFAVFEFVGGILTGSVAILSDAVHDLGDAASIGIAWFLERKSKKQPDHIYTYGYARYSVVGSMVTTLILLVGSGLVIYNAVERIVSPAAIHYDGMILFAVVGVIVNLCAAWFTRKGDSLNQKAVNLHMLEDVLGWVVVLVGAVVIRFTNLVWIDPIMSIGVAVFIFVQAVRGMGEVLDVFLEKAPRDVDAQELEAHLRNMPRVTDVHHLHIWTMDGANHYATVHIAAVHCDAVALKDAIRSECRDHGIVHVTIELEQEGEPCRETKCRPQRNQACSHRHGHSHHHHH